MRSGRLPRMLIQITIAALPWQLKRPLLQRFYGYQLDPTARIGLAWIYPRQLHMAAGSRIDALTVAINLDLLELGEMASIGRGNWITGFPSGTDSPHFAHQPDRRGELLLGDHASITKNHHIDCTNRITIGPYTTIAGYSSQLLSHSIDLYLNRQHSEPISIGAYCFVGSNCVILGGSVLPNFCVLGALSLLNKAYSDTWWLYGGQPARRLKPIDTSAGYFKRSQGFVT
jgi:acetyltransferase-like isoleucine patch superfamily enzyme